MNRIRVGINGFGRIGRCAFKLLLADERFEVVGINDPLRSRRSGLPAEVRLGSRLVSAEGLPRG